MATLVENIERLLSQVWGVEESRISWQKVEPLLEAIRRFEPYPVSGIDFHLPAQDIALLIKVAFTYGYNDGYNECSVAARRCCGCGSEPCDTDSKIYCIYCQRFSEGE